ncbi:hypothetical protein SAMN05444338_12011 [Flavobacterium degerlachei]|jgi:hypothetical protein|uniref:Uncharacterized protein n=1 Tax=Flavobacterium degerlachei TaxID=229203 RepID=A0A1H3G6L9_9FLAO|nr:hypothetical protein SAMN05444338_12011 [Flavobacterium degerlachei]
MAFSIKINNKKYKFAFVLYNPLYIVRQNKFIKYGVAY